MSQIEVPKGWKLQKFSDIVDIRTGYAFKSNDYANDGRFILRTLNIKNDGTISKFKSVFLPLTECQKYQKYELKQNDVLMVMVGATIGKIGFVSNDILPALLNQNMWLFRSIEIEPKFLFNFLINFVNQRRVKTQGSGMNFFHIGDFRDLVLPVPEPIIQKKIVQKLDYILGQLEEKEKEIYSLTNYKKLFNSKELLLQNIFDSVLSQKQNKKWHKKSLGLLTIKSQNGMTGKPREKPPGIARLGITTVTHGTFGFINESECKYQKIKESDIANYQIHDKDILVCRQNGNKNFVGKSVVYRGNTKPLIFSDSLIRFQIKTDEINSEFLNMFLNSTEGRIKIESYCQTTAGNYSVNSTNLKKIEVDYPDLDMQKDLILLKNEKLKKIEQAEKEINNFLNLKEKLLLKLENVHISILNLAFSGKLIN